MRRVLLAGEPYPVDVLMRSLAREAVLSDIAHMERVNAALRVDELRASVGVVPETIRVRLPKGFGD